MSECAWIWLLVWVMVALLVGSIGLAIYEHHRRRAMEEEFRPDVLVGDLWGAAFGGAFTGFLFLASRVECIPVVGEFGNGVKLAGASVLAGVFATAVMLVWGDTHEVG